MMLLLFKGGMGEGCQDGSRAEEEEGRELEVKGREMEVQGNRMFTPRLSS